MRFSILTLFPAVVEPYLHTSMMQKAQERAGIKTAIYDIRAFARDKHRTTDDIPYGGGPGMVLKPEPLLRATAHARAQSRIPARHTLIVITNPAGKKLTNTLARTYARKFKHIVLIAGRYEGIDARVPRALRADGYTVREISIGNYVLTGGELAALVIIDVAVRQITGVLGDAASLEEERGGSIPAYTRPEVFAWPEASIRKNKTKQHIKRYCVPKTLTSGHHEHITQWRKKHTKRLHQ